MSSGGGVSIKLFPKQAEALTSDATAILFGGAAGAGKSYLIRAASIIYAIEIPGITVYLFRKNYGDLKANHIDSHGGYLQMLDSMLKDKLVKFNRADYSFEFVNGSRIQMAHLNNESDLGSYLGREFGCLILDEAVQFQPKEIQFLVSRLRLGGLKIPDKWKGKFPRLLMCTNPGGPAHQYLKERYVDLGPGIHQMPSELGGMRHTFIPAFLTDNKVLMENDPNYRDKLLALGVDNPELAQAMLEGNWNISASSAIPHWKREIHAIEPFAIPKSWRVIRGYDWGYSSPYSVLWAAISNGEDYIDNNGEWQSAPVDSVFIIAELYGATTEGKGIKEEPSITAQRIKDIEDGFNAIGIKVHPGPADNAIFSKDRGKSIAQIFSENGITWLRSNKNPGSRVLGLQLINQMLYNATLPSSEGAILKVFRTCPWLCRNLPNLQRSKTKPEDAATDGADHDFDTLKYLILHNNAKMQTKQVTGL